MYLLHELSHFIEIEYFSDVLLCSIISCTKSFSNLGGSSVALLANISVKDIVPFIFAIKSLG